MERPDIFTYTDFRTFLMDLFEFRHWKDKKFTKAKVCRDMGLGNTRSYFHDILNGKYLTPVKANLIAKSFELDQHETKFFKVLVNFNQAFDDPDEREFCFEQLLSLKQSTGAEFQEEQYRYFSKWHYSVIRMLLTIVDVSDDFSELRKRLIDEISLKDIQEAIELLQELQLVTLNEQGCLKPTEKVIKTPAYCQSEVVKGYQVESLRQAQRSVLRSDNIPKRTITKLLSFSEDGLKRVMSALERFSNEINVIVSEDEQPADRIYEMILTLYPYSKGEGDA